MKKYRIFFFVIVLLFETGCVSYISSYFDDIDPVWTKDTPPTENVEPPNGFKITPSETFEIVRNKPWALSMKHIWHIYADSKYYYVHDSCLGSNSSLAKRYGVKIDGKTGKILNR